MWHLYLITKRVIRSIYFDLVSFLNFSIYCLHLASLYFVLTNVLKKLFNCNNVKLFGIIWCHGSLCGGCVYLRILVRCGRLVGKKTSDHLTRQGPCLKWYKYLLSVLKQSYGYLIFNLFLRMIWMQGLETIFKTR